MKDRMSHGLHGLHGFEIPVIRGLLNRFKRLICLVLVAFTYASPVHGQVMEHDEANALPQNSESIIEESPESNELPPAEPKRIFGIIPNYRTSGNLTDYQPLTPKEKFRVAREDSFDRGTVILGALFGGEALFTNSTPSFGHGGAGAARYFAASYTDFVVGNYMTEGIYPTIFHQDPRYFRRGTGSAWSRVGYAVGQIFRTRADSGRMQFNFSEIVGASTSVAASNAYYPDNRNVTDAATRFGIQIGVDMAGNLLKEFAPELSRVFSRKH